MRTIVKSEKQNILQTINNRQTLFSPFTVDIYDNGQATPVPQVTI